VLFQAAVAEHDFVCVLTGPRWPWLYLTVLPKGFALQTFENLGLMVSPASCYRL